VADVVQETFLAAARSAGSYDAARGSLWLWLWGIARRHVALHYRKEKRHDRLRLRSARDWLLARNGQVLRCLEGTSIAPPEVLAAAELATLVRATLTELPAEYENVLTAKYLDGESVRRRRDSLVAKWTWAQQVICPRTFPILRPTHEGRETRLRRTCGPTEVPIVIDWQAAEVRRIACQDAPPAAAPGHFPRPPSATAARHPYPGAARPLSQGFVPACCHPVPRLRPRRRAWPGP
jgi:hypothetical protein